MGLYDWIDRQAEGFFNYMSHHAVIILLCIAVNLAVVALLLALELSTSRAFPPNEIAIEFPQEEEPPTPRVERTTEEMIADEVNRLTRSAGIRNVVRDENRPMNTPLPDAKRIDAKSLYSDVQRVRDEMRRNAERAQAQPEEEAAAANIPNTQTTSTELPRVQHKGPSVVSYSLPGRKARAMPVPAYQCEGGGVVVVHIEVNREGMVVRTSVDGTKSSANTCLQEAAMWAARNCIFNIDPSANTRAKGSVTYLFVAQ